MKNTCVKFFIIMMLFISSSFSDTLNIVYNHSTPPLKFTDINNNPNGMFIDIWKYWAKKNNIKIKFIEASWKDSLIMLKNGKADIHAGLYYTQKRDDIFDYSMYPLFENKNYFFYNKKFVKLISKKNLKPFIVGTGNGYPRDFMQKNYPEIYTKQYSSDLSLKDAFVGNDINIILASNSAMGYFIKEQNHNVEQYNFNDKTFAYTKKYFGAVKKGNQKVLNLINNGFKNISNEEINKIKYKWTTGISENYLKDLEYKNVELTEKQSQYLIKRKELNMCIVPNWLPFESIKNGQHIGLIADIFNEIKKNFPIPISLIHTKTWDESLSYIKNKKCDFITEIVPTKKRKEYISFTKSYLHFPIVVTTRFSEPFFENFQTIIDQNQKIGIVKSYAIKDLVQKKYPDVKFVELNSVEEGLMQVSDGKIFAFLDTGATVSHYILKEGLTNLKIALKVDIDYPITTGVRKDEPMLLEIFNSQLASFDREKLNTIKDRWLKVNFQSVIDYSIIYKTIGFFLIIIIIIMYWNRKLNKEILAKKRVQKELQKAQDEAIKANGTKSDFLAKMSHEIRTPMNAVLGMLYLLEKTQINSIQTNYIKKANYAANSLLGIINDILDFSKIEAGKLDIHNKEFEFNGMISDVLNVMSFKAEEKNLALLTHYDTTIPSYIESDDLRISQILTNLISNAIKFTEKGKVTISTKLLSEKENTVEILLSVKDTGMGISLSSQKTLFDEFSQVDNSLTRRFEGTGLGLAICKKLCTLLGGKIWIKESKEQLGSTFCFTIKCKKSNKLQKETSNDNISNKPLKEESIKYFKNSNILLVEDNELNQEFALHLLKTRDINVDIASNGVEALLKVQNKQYGLILMDIQMPLMDGIEATKKIRDMDGEYFKTVPIVALSANALVGDREKSLNIGMNEHLTKPFDPNKLFKILSKYLESEEKSKLQIDTIEDFGIEKLDKNIFDIKNTVIKLNNDYEVYAKILKQFSNTYLNIFSEIETLVFSKDFDTLKVKIHELKGVSGNIGAVKLYDTLMSIDTCIKKDEIPNENMLNKFKSELSLVMSSIEKLESEVIQSKDFDKKVVLQLLKELENKLEKDIVECIEIHKELLPYLESEHKDFSDSLTLSINNFDTDTAKEIIVNLIKDIQ